MCLPNGEEAIVEPTKITGYLLSDTNTRGRGKAQFFTSFGFSPNAPEALRQALFSTPRPTTLRACTTRSMGRNTQWKAHCRLLTVARR